MTEGTGPRARLFCQTGELAESTFQIEGSATIGSAPDNAVVLTGQGIAAHHARIEYDTSASGFRLVRVGRRAPLQLGPEEVGESAELFDLEVISFGVHHFIFQVLQPAEMSGDEALGTLAAAPDKIRIPGFQKKPDGTEGTDTLQQQVERPRTPESLSDEAPAGASEESTLSLPVEPTRQPVFEDQAPGPPAGSEEVRPKGTPMLLVEVDGESRSYSLSDDELVVGRSAECDIVIDHPSLSRRHASLQVVEGVVTVKDLGSVNGTAVEGMRLEGAGEVSSPAAIQFGLVSGVIDWIGQE